jgi:hypothetical protein
VTELEEAVAATRRGPFDGYLMSIERHLARLYRLSGKMHARDSLPMATTRAPRRGVARLQRRRKVGALRSLARQPLDSTQFVDLQREYQDYFDECTVRPELRPNVDYYVSRLRRGDASYRQIEAELGIPWPFVGLIHAMECGFNFYGHLHNGDPPTARTVHVPQLEARKAAFDRSFLD